MIHLDFWGGIAPANLSLFVRVLHVKFESSIFTARCSLYRQSIDFVDDQVLFIQHKQNEHISHIKGIRTQFIFIFFFIRRFRIAIHNLFVFLFIYLSFSIDQMVNYRTFAMYANANRVAACVCSMIVLLF